MTVLVAIETVAIVLLALLVGGLLRSHAEILRTLHDLGAGQDRPAHDGTRGQSQLMPLPRTTASADAFDVAGISPAGDSVVVGVVGGEHDTMLAFLSTSCLTCTGFWKALRRPGLAVPGDARLVIVTKGPDQESEASVGELAPPGVVTVMSGSAWQDYGVPVAPYFIYVRAPGQVAGDGAAASWEQVSTLLDRALSDDAAAGRRTGGRRDPGESRADRELAAAGILPGDPSLFPTPVSEPGELGEH